MLQEELQEHGEFWQTRLTPQVLARLHQPEQTAPACPILLDRGAIATHLEALHWMIC